MSKSLRESLNIYFRKVLMITQDLQHVMSITTRDKKIQNNAASSYLYDLFDTIHADA